LFSQNRKKFCQNGKTIIVNFDKLITEKQNCYQKKICQNGSMDTIKQTKLGSIKTKKH